MLKVKCKFGGIAQIPWKIKVRRAFWNAGNFHAINDGCEMILNGQRLPRGIDARHDHSQQRGQGQYNKRAWNNGDEATPCEQTDQREPAH